MYKYQRPTQTKSSTVSKIDIWVFEDQITNPSYTRCHCERISKLITLYTEGLQGQNINGPLMPSGKVLKSAGTSCSIFTKRFLNDQYTDLKRQEIFVQMYKFCIKAWLNLNVNLFNYQQKQALESDSLCVTEAK